jgi:hypothetical protein
MAEAVISGEFTSLVATSTAAGAVAIVLAPRVVMSTCAAGEVRRRLRTGLAVAAAATQVAADRGNGQTIESAGFIARRGIGCYCLAKATDSEWVIFEEMPLNSVLVAVRRNRRRWLR